MTEKFTRTDLNEAMERLGMLKFWPADPRVQGRIQELLAEKVPHREALNWLVDQYVNFVGEWKGPSELLGVLATRYTPLGQAPASGYWSSIAGYTAQDGEQKYAERQAKDGPLSVEAAGMLKQLAAGMKGH